MCSFEGSLAEANTFGRCSKLFKQLLNFTNMRLVPSPLLRLVILRCVIPQETMSEEQTIDALRQLKYLKYSILLQIEINNLMT